MSKRQKHWGCTKILLEGGTSDTDRKFLDIEPTPHSVTHGGRRYFRCPNSKLQDPADGQWGMMYLWDGWADWKMQQIQAKEDLELANARPLAMESPDA